MALALALIQGPAGAPPPVPPYSADDRVEDGLPCYICGKRCGKSWASIMDHLKNKHSMKHKDLVGTPLHTLARKEMAAKVKARYQRKKDQQVEK